MRLVRTRVVAAVFVVALVAACGSPPSESTTTTAAPASSTAEAAPFHAIPADPMVVSGTATCTFSPKGGVNPEGGAGFLVVCELDMSDPRVSGTERSDRYRFFNGGEVGDVWVAEEDVITNAEGTWRGTAQAADDGIASGEAHFVGEGAYEGLEFHYYFGGYDNAATAKVRGWISGGG